MGGPVHAAIGATCAAVALAADVEVEDWRILHAAGRQLWVDPLAVYVDHPRAQSGPLALAVSALPRPVFLVGVAALLGVFTWLLERYAGQRLALVGGLVMLGPWAMLAVSGHADDPLVITGAVVMLEALSRKNRRWASLGFAVAVAAKPTAVLLAPALLVGGGFAATALLGGLVWVPFAFADLPALVDAGRGVSFVWHGSLLHLAGLEPWTGIPAWVRPVQLVAGLSVGWWIARKGNLAASVLAAFTIRAVLEPGPWPAYAVPLIALALFARPVLALPAVVLWIASFGSAPGTGNAAVRLAGFVVLLVVCLAGQGAREPHRGLASHGAGLRPRSGSQR